MCEKFEATGNDGKNGISMQQNIDPPVVTVDEAFKDKVPEQPIVNIPQKVDVPGEKAAEDFNAKSANILINLLVSDETARLKQKKPLLIMIGVFVGIQLVLFNGVIIALVIKWWKIEDATLVQSLLDFLKYYIGAVLLELIGMIVFITKNTFTSNFKEILNGIIRTTKKDVAS